MSEIAARCAPFEDDLSALLDEQLDARRAAEVRAHLRVVCRRARGGSTALRGVDAALQRIAATPVDPRRSARACAPSSRPRGRAPRAAASPPLDRAGRARRDGRGGCALVLMLRPAPAVAPPAGGDRGREAGAARVARRRGARRARDGREARHADRCEHAAVRSRRASRIGRRAPPAASRRRISSTTRATRTSRSRRRCASCPRSIRRAISKWSSSSICSRRSARSTAARRGAARWRAAARAAGPARVALAVGGVRGAHAQDEPPAVAQAPAPSGRPIPRCASCSGACRATSDAPSCASCSRSPPTERAAWRETLPRAARPTPPEADRGVDRAAQRRARGARRRCRRRTARALRARSPR